MSIETQRVLKITYEELMEYLENNCINLHEINIKPSMSVEDFENIIFKFKGNVRCKIHIFDDDSCCLIRLDSTNKFH
jgi:hypothetical protein